MDISEPSSIFLFQRVKIGLSNSIHFPYFSRGSLNCWRNPSDFGRQLTFGGGEVKEWINKQVLSHEKFRPNQKFHLFGTRFFKISVLIEVG